MQMFCMQLYLGEYRAFDEKQIILTVEKTEVAKWRDLM